MYVKEVSVEFSDEYIAGFFDGEGSVGIYPRSWDRTKTFRYYVLVVSLGQTGKLGKELLESLQEKYGGSVYENKQNGKKKVMWKWNVSANKGAKFLEDILPYSYIKKEEILRCLEFQKLTYKRMEDEEATKLATEIKKLKRA